MGLYNNWNSHNLVEKNRLYFYVSQLSFDEKITKEQSDKLKEIYEDFYSKQSEELDELYNTLKNKISEEEVKLNNELDEIYKENTSQ